MTHAVFFISTGRCATQWFAKNFDEYFRDIAHVCHERFHKEYQARYYYTAHKREQGTQLTPVLEAHVESIAARLTNKHYVETGWPAYGLIPTLIKRFHGRIKIVHLFRHPVATASSLLTHELYHRGDWTEALVIAPSDVAGHRAELEVGWESMSDFQKCLYFWTEINSWALDLRAKCSNVPWLSLKFEDIFGQNGDADLRRLLEFLDFPINDKFIKARAKRLDRYRAKTSEQFYSQISMELPKVAIISEQLGYQLRSFDKEELKLRYYRNKYVALLRQRARVLLSQNAPRIYRAIKQR